MKEKQQRQNDRDNKSTKRTISTEVLPVMFILWVTIIIAIAPTTTTTINSIFQTAYAQKDFNTPNKVSVVKVDNTNYQVKYNVTNNDAKVVSIVPQKESTKLVITIEPTNNGKLTIELPRTLIDYKIAGGKDGNFILHINGKQVDNVREVSNNQSARILEISFGAGDRTIEIIGTQMGQGPVALVKSQVETSANKTMQTLENKTSIATAKGPAETFVNKTIGTLSNLTGGIQKLFNSSNKGK
jgi:hypothetical protein